MVRSRGAVPHKSLTRPCFSHVGRRPNMGFVPSHRECKRCQGFVWLQRSSAFEVLIFSAFSRRREDLLRLWFWGVGELTETDPVQFERGFGKGTFKRQICLF